MSLLKRKEQELEELYFDDDYDLQQEDYIEQLETEEEIEKINLKQQIKNELKADVQQQVTEDIMKELQDDYSQPEIIESISEDEYQSKYNFKTNREKRYFRWKKIINTAFVIILLILTLITIDVIAVSKFNAGPFFAIKTKTYDDGGSKEYYGIGYKVIKYNQEIGRRDKEIGSWKLKYNTEPINLTDFDLSIEFYGNKEATNVKYYKQFVRLSSTVKSVNKKKNQVILQYTDEDDKYTFQIICNMAKGQENIDVFTEGDKVYTLGTISKFAINPSKVYLDDCFLESYEIISESNIEE